LNPDDNQVFVGPYPCPIPLKGVSETSIQCVTTAAINPNRLVDLDVKVRVSGRPDSKCDASDPTLCRFSYRQITTPSVHSLSTRAGYPEQ